MYECLTVSCELDSSWHILALIYMWGKGHAMAQVVSRRSFTAEAQVRSWVSPCGICGG
jgi:hypothetical protein